MNFETYIQTRYLRPIRLKAILKILNKLPPGTIVDFGCMDDYLLKRLPSKFDYTGYDADPWCHHPKIIKSKVEDIPKKKYDIALCTEVLEHLDDPVAGMRKLKEMSNRFVLVSVPREPFFAFFRLFVPAREHLWTIFPWAFWPHLGKPVLTRTACFGRTYIALFDLHNIRR